MSRFFRNILQNLHQYLLCSLTISKYSSLTSKFGCPGVINAVSKKLRNKNELIIIPIVKRKEEDFDIKVKTPAETRIIVRASQAVKPI